jgi:hypothetical protein
MAADLNKSPQFQKPFFIGQIRFRRFALMAHFIAQCSSDTVEVKSTSDAVSRGPQATSLRPLFASSEVPSKTI